MHARAEHEHLYKTKHKSYLNRDIQKKIVDVEGEHTKR